MTVDAIKDLQSDARGGMDELIGHLRVELRKTQAESARRFQRIESLEAECSKLRSDAARERSMHRTEMFDLGRAHQEQIDALAETEERLRCALLENERLRDALERSNDSMREAIATADRLRHEATFMERDGIGGPATVVRPDRLRPAPAPPKALDPARKKQVLDRFMEFHRERPEVYTRLQTCASVENPPRAQYALFRQVEKELPYTVPTEFQSLYMRMLHDRSPVVAARYRLRPSDFDGEKPWREDPE